MSALGAVAVRLIAEGRVQIMNIRGGRDVFATVDDGESHQVRRLYGSWRCSCAEFGDCPHVLAVRMVIPPLPEPERRP